MLMSRCGVWPLCLTFRLMRVFAVLAVAFLLGACSTRQAAAPEPQLNYVAANPGDFTTIPAKVELEADGIEVQRPPVYRARQAPDDPTQPYSPNYGSIDPGVAAMANEAEPWMLPEDYGNETYDPATPYSDTPDGETDDQYLRYDQH